MIRALSKLEHYSHPCNRLLRTSCSAGSSAFRFGLVRFSIISLALQDSTARLTTVTLIAAGSNGRRLPPALYPCHVDRCDAPEPAARTAVQRRHGKPRARRYTPTAGGGGAGTTRLHPAARYSTAVGRNLDMGGCQRCAPDGLTKHHQSYPTSLLFPRLAFRDRPALVWFQNALDWTGRRRAPRGVRRT